MQIVVTPLLVEANERTFIDTYVLLREKTEKRDM